MFQLMPMIPVWLIIPFGLALIVTCVAGLVTNRGPKSDWVRRLLMVCLVVAIALRPVTADEALAKDRMNANVFFVVDRTGSMNAEDYDGNKPRIEGVKHDMRAIMDMTEGSRYSILSFDSAAASQLPLTTDAGAVKAWIDTLQTENTAMSSGSNVDRPVGVLQQEIARAQEEDPKSHTIVYFLSDGENTDEKQSQRFAEMKKHIDAGAVLGYGTPQGGPMKVQGGPDEGSYIQDPAGGNGISTIDEDNLTRIADELGVAYVPRGAPGGSLKATMEGITLTPVQIEEEQMMQSYEDWYWIPAIVLALCAVWELVAITLRLPRRIERSDIPDLVRGHQ